MLREIIVGVVTALVVSLIFYIWKIAETVSITIPENAVIAFHDDECPDVGWEEYKPAYGRFIRGLDKSETHIDPAGLRGVGSKQEDLLGSHQHKIQVSYSGGQPGAWSLTHNDPTSSPEYSKMQPEGGVETRPKNIALLYCIKK